jgi:hypothetical protein
MPDGSYQRRRPRLGEKRLAAQDVFIEAISRSSQEDGKILKLGAKE